MSVQERWGLLCPRGPVPLEGVRVDARVSGPCVEVTVTQRYRNQETKPVEAVYVFPLDEASAVCGFAARVGDKLVRGSVREREEAFAAYDDAMYAGDGAFLLEQERPNVFTASVGNLRPGEAVELQLRYVALLAREGSALRLAIPTTVSPRYVPQAKPTVGQPEGERVNPPYWPAVPYGLSLSVQIADNDLKRVESPSHPIRTTLDAGGVLVELSQEAVALDRDFVLLVERRMKDAPLARVAREADGSRVLMLSFAPERIASSSAGHEVLFLLDCSGSMMGASIAEAKRALLLCMRALNEGDTFNVMCFGSQHRALWRVPRPFDQASLDEASSYVAAVEADLGGTEILAPLTQLLSTPNEAGRERRVLVLTDGQVSNEAEVIALSREHASEARIFAFGIGRNASEHLVRGLARASRGVAEMIFPGERIEPKVLRTFRRVRTAALDDARVDYGELTVEQAPRRTPPVFAGDVLTVFARVERGNATHVELVMGDTRLRAELDLEHAEADGPIPTLWARERIRELEDAFEPRRGSQQHRPEREEQKRAQLIALGKRYCLLSSAVSFVAIEERSEAERSLEPATLRRIPVAVTQGFGGSTGSLRPRSAVAARMVAEALAPQEGSRSLGRRLLPARRAALGSSAKAKADTGFFAESKRGWLGGENYESLGAPPAAAAPAPTRGPAPDRVFELLMTQRADGSFPPSQVLTAWLGKAGNVALGGACTKHDEALVITCVVIALLARDAPDRKSEWLAAVDKARAFCARQKAAFDPTPVVEATSDERRPDR